MSSKIIKVKARAAKPEIKKLPIQTAYIKLDSALKFAGEADTGGEAKKIISDGIVFVNGAPCRERGRKLHAGDTFRYGNTIYEIETRHENSENNAEKLPEY